MGLEMYAFRTKVVPSTPTDFDNEVYRFVPEEQTEEEKIIDHIDDPNFSEAIEIAFWNNHQDLQWWMETLYHQKGGTKVDLNCTAVRLLPEDIDKLEDDVKNCRIFNKYESTWRQKDLDFVTAARAAFADGEVVFYDSW